jgi:RNA polymerase sigma factor (sigma-70 family)
LCGRGSDQQPHPQSEVKEMTETTITHQRVLALYDKIQRIARRYFYQEHEDLAQIVVTRLLCRPQTIPKRVSRAWLETVVRRTACDLSRTARRRFSLIAPGLSLNIDGSIAMDTDPDYKGFAAEAVYKQEYNFDTPSQVNEALMKLPPEQRQTLELFAYGLNYFEIAKITNAEVGTVRSRLHYARKKARVLLADLA